LRDKVAGSGLERITVVAGEASGTGFPAEGCDGLFLRDVYHHFTEPGAMNASIFAALKPGGRAAVVDFTPPREAAAPADRAKDGSHGVMPDTVVRELKEAGFEVVSKEAPGGRWFLVVVSKPER
jgi:predicted methyltransferase